MIIVVVKVLFSPANIKRDIGLSDVVFVKFVLPFLVNSFSMFIVQLFDCPILLTFKWYRTHARTRFFVFRLKIRLSSTDGDTWREQLPSSQDDDELFFLYLKRPEQSYDWHQMNADQFYGDACFVLAIRCYTRCIELQPDESNSYLKRAACYLKVYEVNSNNKMEISK